MLLWPVQVSLPTQYNDQQQAPVGALSGALGRIQANRPLRELREIAKGVTKQLPEPFQVSFKSQLVTSQLVINQLFRNQMVNHTFAHLQNCIVDNCSG